MAYAASLSLISVIKQLCYSSDGFEKFDYPESILSLERLARMAVNIQPIDFEKGCPKDKAFAKEFRDSLWKAEDIIESYLLTRFFSSESMRVSMDQESNFSQDILQVVEEMQSSAERFLQRVNDDSDDGFSKDSISEAGGSVTSSAEEFAPILKSKMIGLESELEGIKYIMMTEPRQHLGAVVIHGMGGIGKTSLAISIYNDSEIRIFFSIVAWVKLSFEHCVRDILLNLLRTVEVTGHGRLEELIGKLEIEEIDDERLTNFVQEIFAPLRFLVIVDCLCEVNQSSWEYIKGLLPDSNNGSRIILVNRMRFLDDCFVLYSHNKSFLKPNASWGLLRELVFGDEQSPRGLESIGKRIAENCKGLPLAIVTVASHLVKEEKTVEYWNKVAETGNSLAYKADGAPMFEQLGLSYTQLPQRLRLLLLYMGVFPENYHASFSELQNMWAAEEFLHMDECTLRCVVLKWILYLGCRNIITCNDQDDTFSVHHAMWHFCCFKGEEEEFSHVMDKCCNDFENSTQGLSTLNIRRLVIRKTLIFTIGLLEDMKLSGIRSILFTGDYHPYPLTRILWDTYKLLRVLNARSIRFYEFPDEILCLKLVYLSLTLNGGELPHGISKMRRLQFLIVHFHHTVRSFGGDPKYLPMEIWEMQQLQHLEVIGFDLPIPPPHSPVWLPRLATLYGVSQHSCREEVLERIPNLTDLRIIINLAPTPKNDADGAPLCSFNHLAVVQQLMWLHYVIINPYFEGTGRPQVDTMPKMFSVSMNNLTTLNLSGCGFPWDEIKQISQFPSLNMLYLKCRAFRGPKWEPTSPGFDRLENLVLEDLDLVYWTESSGDDQIFPRLKVLVISRCQKLQQLPSGFARCPDLKRIEVTDNSLAVETWARSVQTELSNTHLTVVSISSPRGVSTLI